MLTIVSFGNNAQKDEKQRHGQYTGDICHV